MKAHGLVYTLGKASGWVVSRFLFFTRVIKISGKSYTTKLDKKRGRQIKRKQINKKEIRKANNKKKQISNKWKRLIQNKMVNR